MATLWVVVGFHCQLEVLPGFEFLSCCQHSTTAKAPAHHANDCDDDGCATIELGFFKQADPPAAPATPLLAFVAWLVPLPDDFQADPLSCLATASPVPPDLSRIWQFFQRTALPPRAPSFVS